jgi:hypothetical protein
MHSEDVAAPAMISNRQGVPSTSFGSYAVERSDRAGWSMGSSAAPSVSS